MLVILHAFHRLCFISCSVLFSSCIIPFFINQQTQTDCTVLMVCRMLCQRSDILIQLYFFFLNS